MKIYIAQGHGTSLDGSFDPGCTYQGETEASLMEQVALGATEALRVSGHTVITDAPENKKNIKKTVEEANQENCEIYLSCHCDYEGAPSGVLTIVYPGVSSAKEMAERINTTLSQGLSYPNRGIIERDDYEVAYTTMPAVIVECGSIKEDLALLKNSAKRIGEMIAEAILGTYSISPKNTSSDTVQVSSSEGNLSLGSVGSLVKTLQQGLYALCYQNQNGENIEADGIFGENTKESVMALQTEHSLEVDGIYGEKSKQAMRDEIRCVQRLLVKKGFEIAVDGLIGPETSQAIRDFQSAAKLVVDGIVGSNTMKALKS